MRMVCNMESLDFKFLGLRKGAKTTARSDKDWYVGVPKTEKLLYRHCLAHSRKGV